jgi:triacylglycerol lipase
VRKPDPVYSLQFVFHPEQDAAYRHFEGARDHPFQAASQDLPRVNVWWLAEAALLSYWQPAEAIPIFEAAGFQAEFLTAQGTDCYVVWQKDFVITAFRGTQPDQWEDILADANIVLVPWQRGRVHLGFKNAFDVIRPRLDARLAQLSPGRTLWFCGHSLGAALATLAADHDASARACTFGSPRVGDRQFAQAFAGKMSGRLFRYVNDHDVVTHVPLPIPYEHVASERFIAPDGLVSQEPPAFLHFFADLIGEPKALIEVIRGLENRSLLNGPMFLLDHMPKAYAIWSWNDYVANQSSEPPLDSSD